MANWARYGGVPGMPSGLEPAIFPGAGPAAAVAEVAQREIQGAVGLIGFDITLREHKGGFFDRALIRRMIGAVAANALSRFGAYVMTKARRSIRQIGPTRRPALPGNPPKSRTGLLKNFILFSLDSAAMSVVIGPAKLPGMIGNAPQALEYGGPSEWRRPLSWGGGRIPVMIKPHPYMRPAFEEVSPQWPAIWAAAQAAGPGADWTKVVAA